MAFGGDGTACRPEAASSVWVAGRQAGRAGRQPIWRHCPARRAPAVPARRPLSCGNWFCRPGRQRAAWRRRGGAPHTNRPSRPLRAAASTPCACKKGESAKFGPERKDGLLSYSLGRCVFLAQAESRSGLFARTLGVLGRCPGAAARLSLREPTAICTGRNSRRNIVSQGRFLNGLRCFVRILEKRSSRSCEAKFERGAVALLDDLGSSLLVEGPVAMAVLDAAWDQQAEHGAGGTLHPSAGAAVPLNRSDQILPDSAHRLASRRAPARCLRNKGVCAGSATREAYLLLLAVADARLLPRAVRRYVFVAGTGVSSRRYRRTRHGLRPRAPRAAARRQRDPPHLARPAPPSSPHV